MNDMTFGITFSNALSIARVQVHKNAWNYVSRVSIIIIKVKNLTVSKEISHGHLVVSRNLVLVLVFCIL